MNNFLAKPVAVQVLVVAVLILAAGVAYGSYAYYSLHTKHAALEVKFGEVEAALATTTDKLALAEEEKEGLRADLEAERDKMNDLEREVRKITGTVGTLEKLSKTDKELLQKYSKVYFLNEHYVPPRLTDIDSKYIAIKGREEQIHSSVRPFLRRLLDAADDDDVPIRVVSAYRSFGTQAALKSSYVVTYGAGTANQFSADQGYSEHQLGTAVDLTTSELGTAYESFESSPAYQWMIDNAYRYGFVLSYPKGNTYYQFEPWHWRFVGEDLALYLHRSHKYFYDMDQRDIDKYLVSIFD